VTEEERNRLFDDWISRYKALIFSIVRAYAGTPMDRDDLFQEVSIQVWRSIPSFRHESAVTTWLYRVALNTALRWTTRERKHSDTREPLERAEHILQEAKTDSDERLNWLYQEISALDVIDRSVCLLLLEGFSYREMADILGISESNVGVKINRVKKKLAEKSKSYDHGI
jgi:RNA polymerase sigma-70 factor, ECF subfamily